MGPGSLFKHELSEFPEEGTQLPGNCDDDFVAVHTAFTQVFESMVEAILGLPAEVLHPATLASLSGGELSRHFGLFSVVLSTLD